jgi:WD40 repeat protein
VLRTWSPADRRLEESSVIAEPGKRVSLVNWSRDGQRVVAVTTDSEVTADDAVHFFNSDGTDPVTWRPDGSRGVEFLSTDFSEDGSHLVVAGRIRNTAESVGWVLKTGTSQPTKPAASVDSAASEDASSLVSVPDLAVPDLAAPGVEKGSSVEQDASASLVVCVFSGHEAGGISSVRFVPRSSYVVSGGNDGSLILWNWRNPLPTAIPAAYEAYRFFADAITTAHSGPVTSVTVSPAGEIVSGSDDGKLILWNLPLLTARK